MKTIERLEARIFHDQTHQEASALEESFPHVWDPYISQPNTSAGQHSRHMSFQTTSHMLPDRPSPQAASCNMQSNANKRLNPSSTQHQNPLTPFNASTPDRLILKRIKYLVLHKSIIANRVHRQLDLITRLLSSSRSCFDAARDTRHYIFRIMEDVAVYLQIAISTPTGLVLPYLYVCLYQAREVEITTIYHTPTKHIMP
jgi:hypothetical protein